MALHGIKVTINQDNVPEEGYNSSMKVISPMPRLQLTLQEDVLVRIIDNHHSFEAIVEMCNENGPMFELYINTLSLYLTLRSNGHPPSDRGIMKSRKFLNTDSSTMLPCTEFMSIIQSVVSYASKFIKEYSMVFQKGRIVDV